MDFFDNLQAATNNLEEIVFNRFATVIEVNSDSTVNCKEDDGLTHNNVFNPGNRVEVGDTVCLMFIGNSIYDPVIIGNITHDLKTSFDEINASIDEVYTSIDEMNSNINEISSNISEMEEAINEKANQTELDSLKNDPTNTPYPISSGDDLNDYVEAGFYYSPTGTVSQTLSNCPVTNAFALFVEKSSGYENACTQTITAYNGTRMMKFSRFIQTINGTLQNSGWQPLYDDTGFTTVNVTHRSFGLYTSGSPMTVRRIGNMVQFNGIVKNTSAITLKATEVTIATIPSEYRPSYDVYSIMQGSATNIFLLHITSAGNVRLSRYRANTTSYSSISSGAWFPMHITYMI